MKELPTGYHSNTKALLLEQNTYNFPPHKKMNSLTLGDVFRRFCEGVWDMFGGLLGRFLDMFGSFCRGDVERGSDSFRKVLIG